MVTLLGAGQGSQSTWRTAIVPAERACGDTRSEPARSQRCISDTAEVGSLGVALRDTRKRHTTWARLERSFSRVAPTCAY